MKKIALAISLLAALTACSSDDTAGGGSTAPPPADEAGNTPQGALELAISQTCTPGSEPRCIPVNGEHVLVAPTAFERAGVDSASGAPPSGESDMITVTLDGDGTRVVSRMTAEATHAGDHSRLVMKVGDHIISSVRVRGELRSEQLQVALPPGAPTEDILEDLNGAGE
ncbi:hypothetical protein [Dietzia sp. PP-33]|jgi:hypothetical protein|uniref:hypothetical protein n=1 Tax=Dietzia sp. PP-33 TaxID=2957500 RepID=UPI0029B26D63|nr:hypothetical protein [Dietzia sp. PP-33]MDX2355365.1 hypothetical protein [Dietzia sp. PP-33]